MHIETVVLELARDVRGLISTHHFWTGLVSRETRLGELDKLITDLETVIRDLAPAPTNTAPTVDVTK